jgi:hypothetical protein
VHSGTQANDDCHRAGSSVGRFNLQFGINEVSVQPKLVSFTMPASWL